MATLTSVSEIERAFFRAMAVGWAGNGPVTIKPRPIEGRPRSHCIEYPEGDWLVTDEYYTTIGKK